LRVRREGSREFAEQRQFLLNHLVFGSTMRYARQDY
jgi:hypothetical protein